MPVMEGGPPGSLCRRGAQTAVVSCRSKAGGGSDYTNGSHPAGQVRDEKQLSMVEPLLTHRKTMTASQPGVGAYPRESTMLLGWRSDGLRVALAVLLGVWR